MTTRRQLFQFAGGSAVGLMLTPAPWRVLTDLALWSENWPGVPRPARGEVRFQFTHCALCPAGCAVRARCVGDRPVSMAGVNGGLCPAGVTGHHLPYHPARLLAGDRQKAAADVAGAMARMKAEERLAVLDLAPGRTASWSYRRSLAALDRGVYLAPEEPACAVDLLPARTVLSVGVPLFDGWGRPVRVKAARPNFRLIQVEAMESGTAMLADDWLAVRAGSEAMVARAAAGLATVEQAAEATGLSAERIAAVVKSVREDAPAVIIGPEMSAEVLGWNVRIGAWGKTVFPRREAPVPKEWSKAAPVTRLAAVADGSLRVLLIDDSAPGAIVPWAEIQPKLAADAVVVAFSWSRGGYAGHATHVLPTAVYPEAPGDLPAPMDAPAREFRLTVPLMAAPEGMTDPVEFAGALAELDVHNALRERADAIHAAARLDGKPDDFWKALNAGHAWTGKAEPCGRAPEIAASTIAAPAPDAQWPLRLAFDSPAAPPLASPLFSKLWQESQLCLGPGRVALHPDAAFENGMRAALETPYGRRQVEVTLDASVPPGIVLAGGWPEVSAIHGADGRARLVRI